MNNYNFLEKLLHHLALSSQVIREVTFDLEKLFISSNHFKDDHVFITGLARSGTTILLNAIYESDIFASLTYQDMPFLLAPNLWHKINNPKKKVISKERLHADGINFSIRSPEAFEEVFWKTFDDNYQDSYENFSVFIDNVIWKYKKKRYLSKNNNNIKRILDISEYFPNSKILIPFREPTQHAFSLFNQHLRFLKLSKKNSFIAKYMKLIGHTEFGPNYSPLFNEKIIFRDYHNINHWIEQWYLNYRECLENCRYKKNVHFVSYEKLCHSRDYWNKVLTLINIKKHYTFSFRELKKEVKLEINYELYNKASLLYSELSQLPFLK